MNLLSVVCFDTQGAEELYFCKGNGHIYVRQPVTYDSVRWLTTSKWSGGYEADTPLARNTLVQICDTENNVHVESVESDGVAQKKVPFVREAVKQFSNSYRKNNPSIIPYEEWVAMLVPAKPEHIYQDNWLFACAKKGTECLIQKVLIRGLPYQVVETAYEHKCGLKYRFVELFSDEVYRICAELIGFVIESGVARVDDHKKSEQFQMIATAQTQKALDANEEVAKRVTVGENIKYFRECRGLTQQSLGKKAGMFDSQIGCYERGENIPRPRTLERIAAALDVTVDELKKG